MKQTPTMKQLLRINELETQVAVYRQTIADQKSRAEREQTRGKNPRVVDLTYAILEAVADHLTEDERDEIFPRPEMSYL